MAHISTKFPKWSKHRADPSPSLSSAVRKGTRLREEAIVVVHQPVPNKVIRHGERPKSRLLQIIRLVIVCSSCFAPILYWTDDNVVGDGVFHLVAIFHVDSRAFDVKQHVFTDKCSVGAVDNDPSLFRVLNCVAHKLASGTASCKMKVQGILAS